MEHSLCKNISNEEGFPCCFIPFFDMYTHSSPLKERKSQDPIWTLYQNVLHLWCCRRRWRASIHILRYKPVTINSTTGTVTMNNASGQTFMTMTRGTANGMMTFTINSANYPSVTVTTATCDSGYVGATATTTSINIPANCGTVTYCVNSTNPLSVSGAYYLIGGKKVTVDMTQLMQNGTTVNMTYAQSLGLQIANACVGL